MKNLGMARMRRFAVRSGTDSVVFWACANDIDICSIEWAECHVVPECWEIS